jgi:hypothetical protein
LQHLLHRIVANTVDQATPNGRAVCRIHGIYEFHLTGYNTVGQLAGPDGE